MAYCTTADALAFVRPPALGDNSSPTSDEADDMVQGIADDMDAAIASHGHTVPVTAPARFVAWLEAVNAWGAAATILTARFADDKGVNSNTAGGRLERRYQKALAKLWDGSAIPGGVGGTALSTSYAVEYPDEAPDDLGDIQDPAFPDSLEL